MIFYKLPGFCRRSLDGLAGADEVIMNAGSIAQLNGYILDTPGTGMTRLENLKNCKYGRCVKRAIIKKEPLPDRKGWDENALSELEEGENVAIRNEKDGYKFITCEYYSGWVNADAVEECGTLTREREEYMSYTLNNLISTACSFLGTPYGWGGNGGGTDCSGFVRAVYKTFGIRLPRDCSAQALIPTLKYELAELSEDEKSNVLKTLPPGAILQFEGHEMLYLCECSGEHYVINAVNTIVEPSNVNVIKHPAAVVINSLSMLRPNKKSWLSELRLAIVIK